MWWSRDGHELVAKPVDRTLQPTRLRLTMSWPQHRRLLSISLEVNRPTALRVTTHPSKLRDPYLGWHLG